MNGPSPERWASPRVSGSQSTTGDRLLCKPDSHSTSVGGANSQKTTFWDLGQFSLSPLFHSSLFLATTVPPNALRDAVVLTAISEGAATSDRARRRRGRNGQVDSRGNSFRVSETTSFLPSRYTGNLRIVRPHGPSTTFAPIYRRPFSSTARRVKDYRQAAADGRTVLAGQQPERPRKVRKATTEGGAFRSRPEDTRSPDSVQ